MRDGDLCPLLASSFSLVFAFRVVDAARVTLTSILLLGLTTPVHNKYGKLVSLNILESELDVLTLIMY